jgi:hypothetical protein
MCKTGTIYTLQSNSVSKVESRDEYFDTQYIWNAGFNYTFGRKIISLRKLLSDLRPIDILTGEIAVEVTRVVEVSPALWYFKSSEHIVDSTLC